MKVCEFISIFISLNHCSVSFLKQIPVFYFAPIFIYDSGVVRQSYCSSVHIG